MQNEEKIRQRAYEIWMEKGQPEGEHQEHWAQACTEKDGKKDDEPDKAPGNTEQVPDSTR